MAEEWPRRLPRPVQLVPGQVPASDPGCVRRLVRDLGFAAGYRVGAAESSALTAVCSGKFSKRPTSSLIDIPGLVRVTGQLEQITAHAGHNLCLKQLFANFVEAKLPPQISSKAEVMTEQTEHRLARRATSYEFCHLLDEVV